MANSLDLTYPGVMAHFEKYVAKGRTESRAFLAWFLENYFRLDDVAATDAICDGRYDKGVDGIYVDDNLEQVVVLQSRLLRNAKKTLGDTPLKMFYGTLAQFMDPERIATIAEQTINSDLRNLIKESRIEEKVREGYSIRGVFVTNALADPSARDYVANCPDLDLYDAQRIQDSYIPSVPTGPQATPVAFDLSGCDVIEYTVDHVTALFALVSATELLKLDGLQSGELFVWNVRRSLGRTKVNKEISKSIKDETEHSKFVLYHNGITILCQEWKYDRNMLSIAGYTVVNGAQSLTSLYENRSAVTSDLRMLVRFIKLSPDSELAARITHHSNNQNTITARDLQSTSTIQRRLQNEFSSVFPNRVFYRIQRGEESDLPIVIDNEDAARVMLAFDLQQPWTCHQTYKLFDELHTEIFGRPEVNAYRILAQHILQNAVVESLGHIQDEMLAKYRLTRYFVLYLLRRVMELDTLGKAFVKEPSKFVMATNGESRLAACTRRILRDLLDDLNAELAERQENGQPFDFKRELKSPRPVMSITKEIITSYRKGIRRNRAKSFEAEWAASG